MYRDERRNALSRAVASCRRTLVGDRKRAEPGDIGAQLEAPYGFDVKSGRPQPLEQMKHLSSWQRPVAAMLRDWHAVLVSQAADEDEALRVRAAYDQMKYEIGFVALHRLAALRMAEERGIVTESVRKGRESSGFRLYQRLAGETALGGYEEAYAQYLGCLFDELARELPGVFDRRSPASLLFPRPKALDDVLAELDTQELAELFRSEADTLGWIFEEYNDAEERKEMRAHDAPRNARELAVRNQFFTPRWVVAFLTDNTLGRLWVEQTGGETQLLEQCQYLLKPKDLPAAAPRDPRTIAVLDPACGSGHFLLYVFDLLDTIYREAWAGRFHRSEGLTPLWEQYPDERGFFREIPGLIIEHNLHGVDIDARCIQEAELSLWLRAHEHFDKIGVKGRERPTLGRAKLVCATSLPNDPAFRARLAQKLEPALFSVVEKLFVDVGEMGVLLRAEGAIDAALKKARKEAIEARKRVMGIGKTKGLFPEFDEPQQVTLEEQAALGPLLDETRFWQEAEGKILEVLRQLAEEDEEATQYKNRIVAEAVQHGLEFFDISRKKYDVVLMNPPFGSPATKSKAMLDEAYPDAGHDLYAMFYERTLEMLGPAGRVGAITNRAWLALPTMTAFRKELLGEKGSVEVAADLGYGVLNAKVETVAAVVRKGGDKEALGTWVRLVKTGRKEETLREALREGEAHRAASVVAAKRFESLPANVCGYWMSEELAKVYTGKAMVGSVADVKQGTATADDPRFLRLSWEVSAFKIGLEEDWARFAKGGEYRPYFDDIHLVIRWTDAGKEIVAWGKGRPQNIDYFGLRGVTWPPRTNLRLCARSLPAGCAFGHKGPSAFAEEGDNRKALLAILCASPAYLLLSIRFQTADDSPQSISKSYEVGLIRDLPWPSLTDDQQKRLATLTTTAVEIVRLGQIEDDDTGETTVAFAVPPVLLPLPSGARPQSLEEATRIRVVAREERVIRVATIQAEIDDIVATAYGFSDRDRQVMHEELEPPLATLPGTESIDEAQFRRAYMTKEELDGEAMPGGLDAEMDVRVEHRRKKQVKFRDEATLCRLFQAPPARIAEERRRQGLLRDDDLYRAAADIVSYAVGAAFGRWDLRLAAHPAWLPAFADPFDPLPPCPLGQLVNAEGLPATATRIASEAWLAARSDPTKLPEGEPSAWETTQYPVPIAWNGLLVDDTLDDAQGHRPEGSFLGRVERVLEHLFGDARPAWEHDIAEALGVASITDWLRSPNGFFADHLSRYSKSRRQAPIYWPLSTASGGFVAWVYAPRLEGSTLPAVVNRLRERLDHLRKERERLLVDDAGKKRVERIEEIEREIRESERLSADLQEQLRAGYVPHADDGFVVTAAPLYPTFRLAKWKDTLRSTHEELVKGDLDWAHLAMKLYPTRVAEKCRGDRSIAIAHGREDLFGDGTNHGASKKPRAKRGATKKAAGKKTTDQVPISWKSDEEEAG
ncbi:BREX-1 system adenine-specific DNA-methyltransferase PglX [Polyangium sp. 15x6]|uniref:BREX-1 system adenine-specific DNA-methyltransferase PglX n=1 Tax=Polyangium sp. 15x6 TaxID=3042687 RepID=UPI00249C047D|nr:BREX-1 system adenine-specific DNA-methyltransferase PglX [Polyangium sp. 15x6]MDI3291592.1 BREX-1 system adenine-specific DNA-methyltransferase PglX [Polyangium sp. 15x6]